MSTLEFLYTNAAGETKLRRLEAWSEEGHYVVGHDVLADGPVRTFRKDRIVEYLGGCEKILVTPFAGPPPKLVREAAGGGGSAPKPELPQILFTGFPAKTRAEFEAASAAAGLEVVKSVTQRLTFLCAGPNAGPTKLAKARIQGVYIVTDNDLPAFLESGVLPDSVEC